MYTDIKCHFHLFSPHDKLLITLVSRVFGDENNALCTYSTLQLLLTTAHAHPAMLLVLVQYSHGNHCSSCTLGCYVMILAHGLTMVCWCYCAIE